MGCADNSISRWTAPTVELLFPRTVDFIRQIRITFAQGIDEKYRPKIVIVKTEADAEFEGNKVTFRLTQEDTLRLSADELVQIEVQVYDIHGVPFVGDAVKVRVQDVVNEGVTW